MKDYYVVTYEQADKLKELGFNWECFYYYYFKYTLIWQNKEHPSNRNHSGGLTLSAPFFWQAQKWLREIKNTDIIVQRLDEEIYDFIIYGNIVNVTTNNRFNTYDKALSAGIDKALELLSKEK